MDGARHRLDEVLDRAVEAARHEPPGTLGPETRAALFRSIRDESVPKSVSPVFPPIRRWLERTLIPVAAAAMAVALLWLGGPGRAVDGNADARVEARKVGDRVVFVVRNGGRAHTVSRSTTPDRFDASQTALLDRGSFEDRLDTGHNLVFYRID